MKKRMLAGVLALMLVFSLAGCGGGEEEKPAVTLIVKTPTLTLNTVGELDVKSAQEFLVEAGRRFSQAYDKADVTVQVEVFDYVDENAAILGTYGTQDAADVLYEGYFNMAAYVSSGYVVPLDDIIDDALRADISEASWAQSRKNGKTYMMPFLSMQNVLIYNKALLRQCGLERYLTEDQSIGCWSLEDWETILDTLARKLPEGAYPMMMYANNNQGDTHIMSFIRAQGGEIFREDGSFDFSSPACIQGLRWLQNGVERGWYPPHAEFLEINDCQRLFTDEKLAFYLFNNANYMFYENVEENYGFVNFPGDIATSFITGFEVFDNGDADKVQVSKDFVKFIYQDDALLSVSAGNLPESRRVAEKYADRIVMLRAFTDNADNVIDFMHASPNWQGRDDSVRSVFWPHIHALLAGRVDPEACAAGLDRDCNAAIGVETAYHE